MHKLVKDLTNKRFGSLIVIRYEGSDKNGHARWLVHCDCGEDHVMLGDNIVKRANTCGGGKHKTPSRFRHGKSHTMIHNIWMGMRQRCENKLCSVYYRYGGRGIKVCERWHVFENFLEDMGCANENMTLERIDNDGNYEPSNCKWATKTEQNKNKRNNVNITFNGKTQLMSYWAKDLNIPRNTLRNRLKLLDWSVERALTEPCRCQR